ncbi:MAG: hypothetical protein Crog4KO_35420 [Crocinitomicaceae bacterium]
MSQQTMKRNNQQEINAPFRAKSAGVSLVAIAMIGMYYFANVFTLLPGDEAVPDGALSLAITAIILIIIVEVALQIVLFIGAGRIEERSQHDDIVATKASCNAYRVMAVGVFATFASMFAQFTAFEMGSVLLLAFLLAEITNYASQLFYYRRSA